MMLNSPRSLTQTLENCMAAVTLILTDLKGNNAISIVSKNYTQQDVKKHHEKNHENFQKSLKQDGFLRSDRTEIKTLSGIKVQFIRAGFGCANFGKDSTTAAADDTKPQIVQVATLDAAACAKNAELVGENCSYSTGMMAQRVIAEGASWSYTGTLAAADNKLSSHVAAPFTVGPESIYVVANSVLDNIKNAGLDTSRISLEGKLLEVNGVKYFVLLNYKALNA